MASGLNLRTIQRIEKEATASLQSVKALASALDVDIRELEYEENVMLNELLGMEVVVYLGVSMASMSGADSVKGKLMEADNGWLKLMEKKKPVYVNIQQVRKIVPS